MVLIPPGDFLMGSPPTELGRTLTEGLHQVQFTQPFSLGMYEVTQTEFEQVMGFNPSHFKPNPNLPKETNLPVEFVSWFDCIEFCNKLSAQGGTGLLLDDQCRQHGRINRERECGCKWRKGI